MTGHAPHGSERSGTAEAAGPTVIILMGVAGVGKTTVGRLLAERLGWRFLDADDFHPAENVRKMSHGMPLEDADREPWLSALRREIVRILSAEERAVVACSALKRKYRRRLRGGDPRVLFVYLKGSYDLIQKRLASRGGHFFDPALLATQFAALEEPDAALTVEISLRPEDVVERILERLRPHVGTVPPPA